MPGIIPEQDSGALVIRDMGGTCIAQPLVINGYCPGADFTSSCQIRALPSDCTARITPAQINAFQSELLSFAECLDPDGNWDCDELNNLCVNFTSWWEENEPHGDGVTITVDGGPQSSPNRFSIIPEGTADALCANEAARQTLAACVLSDDADNQTVLGSDGLIFTPPGQDLDGDEIADLICGDTSARQTLAACVRSPIGDNQTILDGNGLLYTPPAGPEDICGNIARRREIAACLISSDAGNIIRISDGDQLIYADAEDIVAAICATPAAREALALCVLSSDEFNGLGIGSDNLLYNPEGCVVGSAAITAPDFVGPLPAGTFTHYQEDFFIPNPYPFNVLVEITGATHVRVHDEDPDNTFSYLANWIHNNDPGGAGSDFTMWHWNEGYFPAGGPNHVVFDNTQTFRRFMTIGPGGRAVSARFEVSSVNGIPADVAIRNNTIAFNWNGCQIESLNGA